MSKKTHLEYVKHVPDFLAKLGLSKERETQARQQDAKLEDKFPKPKASTGQEEEKQEYDFEHAQIEDLANMLNGGPLADENLTEIQDQEKLQSILKKRIAQIDKELAVDI